MLRSIGKRPREIHVVSGAEEKEGYGGKDLQKRKVSKRGMNEYQVSLLCLTPVAMYRVGQKSEATD